MGLARLEESLGHMDEAVRWLEKARSTDANAVSARLYLVELYLRTGQTEAAMKVAQETELKAPENLEVLGAVGRCHDALGQHALAQATFRRMADLAGFDPKWLYRIARYQLAVGDAGNAIWSLQKAVKGDPEFLPAQVALTEVQLQYASIDEAEERAQALRARYPERAIGDSLTGDVMMKRGRYAEAAASYRAALAREENPRLAVRLYQALRRDGDVEGAVRFLEHWVDTHPADLPSKQALAEGHLRTGQLDAARVRYEQILAVRPDSPFILNNLAYILAKKGEPRALAYAEQAHELAPEAASVNDTLGWILVQQGQPARGLAYLRDAHYRASADPEIRYHMAVALIQLGRHEEAMKNLNAALGADRMFDGVVEARALRRHMAD